MNLLAAVDFNWIAFAALAVGVLAHFATYVWRSAVQAQKLEEVVGDVAVHKGLGDRVLKLEIKAENVDRIVTEIREQNHKTNGRLQDISLTLSRVADYVAEQKEKGKH